MSTAARTGLHRWEDRLAPKTLTPGQAGRAAVFRPLQLGDLLCAVPALRALRRALPEAELTLVGLPWASEMRERFPQYIDGFIEFPGYPGLPEREPDIQAIPGFLAEAQSRGFDLVLQMHGNGRVSNAIAAMFGGKLTAGFVRRDEAPGHGLFMAYPDHGHEIRRLLGLMEFLGFAAVGEHLEFPVLPSERERAGSLLTAKGVSGRYACIHAGGRSVGRRWPPKAFARIADALSEQGLTVVLTGSATERAINREVTGTMQTGAADLSGATSPGEAGAVLEGATLLVTNDTGVSHMAAALRVPSVVVFSGSDPDRWAPLDSVLHRAVAGRAAGCGPAIGDVLDEAMDLLGGGIVHAS